MQVSYETYESSRQGSAQTSNQGPRVGFFALKNDKDEAIVRIMHDDVSDFDIVAVHPVVIGGKHRKVNCIRNAYDPMEKCPMCEHEVQLQQRLYIHLIEYVKQEDGSVKAFPRVWERSLNYIDTMKNLIGEYGPLSDNIFKIKRNGAAGSMETTYDIMYATPAIYKPEIYKKDESLFNGVRALGTAVLDKTYDELKAMISGNSEAVNTKPAETEPVTPAYTASASTQPAFNQIQRSAPVNEVMSQTSSFNSNTSTSFESHQPVFNNVSDDQTFSRPRRF